MLCYESDQWGEQHDCVGGRPLGVEWCTVRALYTVFILCSKRDPHFMALFGTGDFGGSSLLGIWRSSIFTIFSNFHIPFTGFYPFVPGFAAYGES